MRNSLDYEALKTILDEETFRKLRDFCEGYIVRFPRRRIRRERIVEMYRKLRSVGLKRSAAVRRIMMELGYERSFIYDVLRRMDED